MGNVIMNQSTSIALITADVQTTSLCTSKVCERQYQNLQANTFQSIDFSVRDEHLFARFITFGLHYEKKKRALPEREKCGREKRLN